MSGRISAVDVYVGRRVRAARMAHGRSQEELAHALGVSFQQVQKYEKGVNRIGTGRLHAIAEFLDEPLTYFFDGIEKPQSGRPGMSAITDALSTKEGVRIAVALSRIRNPETRRRIADLLESMIENGGREGRSRKAI